MLDMLAECRVDHIEVVPTLVSEQTFANPTARPAH